MRTRLTTNSAGDVILAYDVEDWEGVQRIERIFSCPVDGGYVYEYTSGERKQVCECLCDMGVTLMSPSRAALPNKIRREYRAMRRYEKS